MGINTMTSRGKWMLAGMMGVILVKLWLVQGLLLSARNYFFDDLLFLRHARLIINGQWLGAFDITTLAKGPGYPLWIALSYFSSLPLLLSQQILYIAACALLIVALQPFAQKRQAALGVLFIVLLFDPQSYSAENMRVLRDFLYATQHLFLLACLVGLLAKRGSLPAMTVWATGLGVCFSFLWLTREESVLVLPTLFLLLGYTGWLIWRERGEHTIPRLAILLLPLLLWGMSIAGVSYLNYRHYGIPTVVEQKTDRVEKALAALQRVKQTEWNRYVPLPREARERIYAASPAFAELKPYLEGEIGKMWTDMSVSRLPALAGREDIGAGWYFWALKNSMMAAGYYRGGQSTMDYYARLTTEVNTACDTGRLACNSPKQSDRFKHLSAILPHLRQSFLDLCRYLVSYEQNRPEQHASTLSNDEEFFLFLDLTLNNIAAQAGQTLPTSNQNAMNRWKIGVLQQIHSGYRLLVPVGYGLAGCGLLLLLGFSLWRRQLPALLVIVVATLMLIMFRLLGLALLDATACSAKPYLGPIYPLAILLPFLLWLSLREMVRRDDHAPLPSAATTTP